QPSAAPQLLLQLVAVRRVIQPHPPHPAIARLTGGLLHRVLRPLVIHRIAIKSGHPPRALRRDHRRRIPRQHHRIRDAVLQCRPVQAVLASIHPVGLPILPRRGVLIPTRRPVPVHIQRLGDHRHHQRQHVHLGALQQPPILLPRTPRHVHAGRLAPHVRRDFLKPRLLTLPQPQQRLRGLEDLRFREGHPASPPRHLRIHTHAPNGASSPTDASATPAPPAASGAPSARRSSPPRRRSSAPTPDAPYRSTPRTGSAAAAR